MICAFQHDKALRQSCIVMCATTDQQHTGMLQCCVCMCISNCICRRRCRNGGTATALIPRQNIPTLRANTSQAALTSATPHADKNVVNDRGVIRQLFDFLQTIVWQLFELFDQTIGWAFTCAKLDSVYLPFFVLFFLLWFLNLLAA